MGLAVEPANLVKRSAHLLESVFAHELSQRGNESVPRHSRYPSSDKHRQAMPELTLLFSVVHQRFLSRETLTVNNLRQFQRRHSQTQGDVCGEPRASGLTRSAWEARRGVG